MGNFGTKSRMYRNIHSRNNKKRPFHRTKTRLPLRNKKGPETKVSNPITPEHNKSHPPNPPVEASPIYQQCIASPPTMHRQATINASPSHRQCIANPSSMHRQPTINASPSHRSMIGYIKISHHPMRNGATFFSLYRVFRE